MFEIYLAPNYLDCVPSYAQQLIEFCHHGRLDLVDLMVTDQLVDIEDALLYNQALEGACISGQVSLIRYLLNRLIPEPETYLTDVPIYEACKTGDLELIQDMVFSGIPYTGTTADHGLAQQSAGSGNIDLFEYIIRLSPRQDRARISYLEIATIRGQVGMVKYLLSRYRYDPDDILFSRYYDYAIMSGSLRLVRMAEATQLDEEFTSRTVELALASGNPDLVKYYRSNPLYSMTMTSYPLTKIYYITCRSGSLDLMKYIHTEVVGPLTDQEILQDGISLTTSKGTPELLEYMIDNDLAPDDLHFDNDSLFKSAVSHDNLPVMTYLFKLFGYDETYLKLTKDYYSKAQLLKSFYYSHHRLKSARK